jgi:hypothetical protein
MPTIGIMTNYLENDIIKSLLRDEASITTTGGMWIALNTSLPSEARKGREVGGGDYARQQVAFTVFDNVAYNTSTIDFPEATIDWGEIVAVSIMDASTSGSVLFWGEMTEPITINTGENFTINASNLRIELSGGTKGGWGDGIAELVLGRYLNNIPFTTYDVTYLATGSSLVVDEYYNFVSWRETPGGATGYSRIRCSGSNWYEPTTGSTTNLNDIIFYSPPIPNDWGRITHVVIFDALTSGNALFWGKLRSPIYITAGDGLKFEAGSVDITLN